MVKGSRPRVRRNRRPHRVAVTQAITPLGKPWGERFNLAVVGMGRRRPTRGGAGPDSVR